MPILGVIASSLRTAADTGAMFPLQVITVGPAGASSVSFTNIPSTYAHLQLRVFARWTSSDYASITFNSGSFLRRHFIYGDGSGAAAGSDTTNAPVQGTTSSGIYSASIVDILDYSNTNKNKTLRTLFGWDANGSGIVQLNSHLYDTSSISSMTISTVGGFAANSQFALYAVKGA